MGNIIAKEDAGLYSDDRLVLLRNMNAQRTDKLRKIIIKLLSREVGFQLKIETNLKKVDVLDITFNLIVILNEPYKKPNYILLYNYALSDYLPQIIKQLISFINIILYEYSACENVFYTAKPEYENALHKNGYKSNLKCSKEIHQYNSKKRARNIFESTISSNI